METLTENRLNDIESLFQVH